MSILTSLLKKQAKKEVRKILLGCLRKDQELLESRLIVVGVPKDKIPLIIEELKRWLEERSDRI